MCNSYYIYRSWYAACQVNNRTFRLTLRKEWVHCMVRGLKHHHTEYHFNTYTNYFYIILLLLLFYFIIIIILFYFYYYYLHYFIIITYTNYYYYYVHIQIILQSNGLRSVSSSWSWSTWCCEKHCWRDPSISIASQSSKGDWWCKGLYT